MFRNKVLVRAEIPSSISNSPFSLISLEISLPPSAAAAPPLPQLLLAEVEALCWKLSRQWRLACLLQSPQILIVYQGCQSESAVRAVEELTERLPIGDVAEEAEVSSGSLIVSAAECVLRSLMLENGWICLGSSSYVDSKLDPEDEGAPLRAVNVNIQSERDDVVFLVSPDVLRFNRHHKDLVGPKMMQRFRDGEQLMLEEFGFTTACATLPCLNEGHVIGLSKLMPPEEDLNGLENLFLFKHGLVLPSNHFICVQVNQGGHTKNQWLPSAFVLQGSGLTPAPSSTRHSNAAHALESFVNIARAWDFFGQGFLKIKEVSSVIIGNLTPVWEKAAIRHLNCVGSSHAGPSYNEATDVGNLIPEEVVSALDFRTPKPTWSFSVGSGRKDISEMHSSTISSGRISGSTPLLRVGSPVNTTVAAALIPLPGLLQSRNANSGTVQGNCTRLNSMEGISDPLPTNNPEPAGKKNDIKYLAEKSCLADSENGKKSCLADSENGKNSCLAESENGKKSCLADSVNGKKSCLTNSENGKKSCLADSENGKKPTKKRNAEKKSKDHSKELPKKARKENQSADDQPDNIADKIMSHHKLGQLGSLTIADLKAFLAQKKAKVGGKKEELIQRITALLLS